MTIGIDARIEPAAKAPQLLAYCPPMNCCKPTATVRPLISTKNNRATMNSLNVPIKLSKQTTASTGLASGMKINQ